MILSVDPGKSTGWAVLWPGRTPFSGEVPGRYEFEEHFELILEQYPGQMSAIICEDYVDDSTAKSRQVDALRIIGYLDGRCHALGIPFILQPRTVQRWSSPAKLRALGWWAVGQDHGRSALKHLLFWLCNTQEGREQGGTELLRKIADSGLLNV